MFSLSRRAIARTFSARAATFPRTVLGDEAPPQDLAEVLAICAAGERWARVTTHGMEIQRKAQEVIRLYSSHGPVVNATLWQGGAEPQTATALVHALRTAQLARDVGADRDMELAALLHGCGDLVLHCQPQLGWMPDRHMLPARLGVQWLRVLGVADRICMAISQQSLARRYLCAISPGYACELSEAAQRDVNAFGGAMRTEEVDHFKQVEDFQLSVTLQLWCDEAAYMSQTLTADEVDHQLNSYRSRLEDHFADQACGTTSLAEAIPLPQHGPRLGSGMSHPPHILGDELCVAK